MLIAHLLNIFKVVTDRYDLFSWSKSNLKVMQIHRILFHTGMKHSFFWNYLVNYSRAERYENNKWFSYLFSYLSGWFCISVRQWYNSASLSSALCNAKRDSDCFNHIRKAVFSILSYRWFVKKLFLRVVFNVFVSRISVISIVGWKVEHIILRMVRLSKWIQCCLSFDNLSYLCSGME